MFGTLPTHPQVLEGQANRLATDLARGQPLRIADLGGQLERPQTGGLTKEAGTLMQQGAQAFPSLGIEDRSEPVRAR